MWEPPEPLPEDQPVFGTLIAGYPGSGKRLLYQMIEALTGGKAGDDWDLSEQGTHVVSLKTSYPHPESPWGWGDNMEQVVFILRNPRYAIPSYMAMKKELQFSETYEQSYLRRDYVYTVKPNETEWEAWCEENFNKELLLWAEQIEFWMGNGLKHDKDGNSYQDTHCGTDIHDCRPKTIIVYEKLSDRATGRREVAKLASVLDGREDIPLIEQEARACVYEETIDNEQPGFRINKHRPGGETDPLGFTLSELLKIKNTFTDLLEIYDRDDLGWGDTNLNAEVIIDTLNEYMAEI